MSARPLDIRQKQLEAIMRAAKVENCAVELVLINGAKVRVIPNDQQAKVDGPEEGYL